MRTRERGSVRAGRRRIGAVSALFLSRRGSREGGQGKQDKGSVSRHVPSLCLHIVFSRDITSFVRDQRVIFGGFVGFFRRRNETLGRVGGGHG